MPKSLYCSLRGCRAPLRLGDKAAHQRHASLTLSVVPDSAVAEETSNEPAFFGTSPYAEPQGTPTLACSAHTTGCGRRGNVRIHHEVKQPQRLESHSRTIDCGMRMESVSSWGTSSRAESRDAAADEAECKPRRPAAVGALREDSHFSDVRSTCSRQSLPLAAAFQTLDERLEAVRRRNQPSEPTRRPRAFACVKPKQRVASRQHRRDIESVPQSDLSSAASPLLAVRSRAPSCTAEGMGAAPRVRPTRCRAGTMSVCSCDDSDAIDLFADM